MNIFKYSIFLLPIVFTSLTAQIVGGEKFTFDNNNIWLPIDGKGVIGDVQAIAPDGSQRTGGWLDEATFLYSSGFTLSGYTNGVLWGNGVMTASRMNHYLNGNVDTTIQSNGIYVVRSSSPDFSESWELWKNAVTQGANFYDGNGDGIYDPVDLNNNDLWDLNEDKPDILGDITAWTVFNDGVPAEERFGRPTDYSNVDPQGIEIKQTVFSFNGDENPELSNVIFIRYSIENMGTVADLLDSVFFSIFCDPDIGYYSDDLSGTDTTLNSAYTYNNGDDADYGVNPPSPFFTILQGPASYKFGETFLDNNDNGVYEDGIDTPLDTAVTMKGELLGKVKYPGAKNRNTTSARILLKSSVSLQDPRNEEELRYSHFGLDQNGELVDPCELGFGSVFEEDCLSVNPIFAFSGNPLTQKGWINIAEWDHRLMNATGPFVLEKGKPIEIIVAYLAGRGTDALNSVTESKQIVLDLMGFYRTNFSYIPVSVNKNIASQLPTEFSL